MTRTIRFCFGALLCAASCHAASEAVFTDAEEEGIKAFLRESFSHTNAGMVIGLVDKQGARVFSAGRLDNDTGQEVNGDTLFEIGSCTKTFTSLLALEMASRGQFRLEDPVAKYLPKAVKVPSHDGKEITLQNLAAQDSGLPFNADNLLGKDWKERFDNYSVEQMYAFLSGYTLTNEPGTKFQYSNFGMSLLGHVMELKAATNLESLMLDRICRPLRMDSTCITLPPELNGRMATGHDENGKLAPRFNLRLMAGAGALLSSANDLLKYLSANLGLTQSSLKPLMDQMKVIRHRDAPEFGNTAMPWWDSGVYQPPGMELLGHGGGTGGCSAFIGFDRKQQRGVVVLANQRAALANSYAIGWRILQRAPLKGLQITTLMPLQEIVGLGAALALNQETRQVWISKVYPKSPAAAAGLSAGLVIQKIDAVSTTGKSLPECLSLLRGKAGTKVRLELVNTEKNRTNVVELTRQKFLISG
jgi:CubicO group peptidase (beta-lactamase class C family)